MMSHRVGTSDATLQEMMKTMLDGRSFRMTTSQVQKAPEVPLATLGTQGFLMAATETLWKLSGLLALVRLRMIGRA